MLKEQFSTKVWALMPMAVALNLLGGKLAVLLKLPVYLDSLGTILMGCLCGPLPAALTGLSGNLLLGMSGEVTYILFSSFSVIIGLAGGFFCSKGLFKGPFPAVIAGAMTGVTAALTSAPISAYLLGGVTGGGTDLVVAYFRSTGRSALEASLAQGLLSDPLDKAVTFLLIQTVLAALPERLLAAFPGAENLRALKGWTIPGITIKSRGSHQRSQAVLPEMPTSFYVPQDSWWHRRNPLTKLLLALLIAESALLLPGTITVKGQLYVANELPILVLLGFFLPVTAQVASNIVRQLMVIWLPLSISLVLIQGLFGPPPYQLILYFHLSQTGILRAITLALRILAVLEAALFLLTTTRPDHLAKSLEQAGLPSALTYVVPAAMQFIPNLQRQIQEVLESQTSRGLPIEGGVIYRIRILLPLIGPILLNTLSQVEERSLALESRGFGSSRRRSCFLPPPDSKIDRILRWILLLLCFSAIVLWLHH